MQFYQWPEKAINHSAGPDGIIPTLLVFGAYPRMTEMNQPAPSVTRRANAVKEAINEIRQLHAKRQVSDALSMRNGPNTTLVANLPLNSKVRVWRENKGWGGPYQLLSVDGETCIIELPNGPVRFRTTVVKP